MCGLFAVGAQKKLLGKKDLTFSTAVDIATAYETVELEAQDMKKSKEDHEVKDRIKEEPILAVSQSLPQQCFCCGKSGHRAGSCRFRSYQCYNCRKRGHLAVVCKSKGSGREGSRSNFQKRSSQRAQYIETRTPSPQGGDDDEETEEFGLYRIHSMRGNHTPPLIVELNLNGTPLKMEVDTGAAVSIISQETWSRVFPRTPMEKADIRLQTYSSEQLQTIGKARVQVTYNNQEEKLVLYVVKGVGPSLLGRSWLSHLRLDWSQIAKVLAVTRDNVCPTLGHLLEKYQDVFSDKVKVIKGFQAKLQLKEGAPPRYHRPRPVPFAMIEAVGRELDGLEAAGIVERVTSSEWAAPLVIVPKKDGKLRLCGDYKVTINPHLRVDSHPLPRAEELFTRLSGGTKFTKLDLSHAYQQMELDSSSRKLVTISTHQGLYQYTRLPFGVASAPAIFQRTMDSILQGLDKVVCFIDDILITGATDDEHLQKLEEVLRRLRQHGMVLKKGKCTFLGESVQYLGHRVDRFGLHTIPEKVEAIVDAPYPKNVSELRSFLGLLNYYNRFIPNLATLIHPLNQLLRNNSKWVWSSECATAMEVAKRSLLSSSALAMFDSDLPVKLATDASSYGVGAVLSHVYPNGLEKPIAFASRTLSSAERNYAQIEKEALAIIFGVKKFHQYVYGRPFVLVTDHKPLTALLGPKSNIPTLAASRMQRWALILSAYIYTIEYRPTGEHGNADALSRLPLPHSSSVELIRDIDSKLNLVRMGALPLTHVQLRNATRHDPILSRVLTFVRGGWPSKVPTAFLPYFSRSAELTVEADCLLWGTRVIIPDKHRDRILTELHVSHPGICRMKALGRSHVWWPGVDGDIEKVAKSCGVCKEVKTSTWTAPLHPWLWPETPWTRIHLDFAGPLNGRMYLLIVDSHSKWPEIWEMRSTTSQRTISVLQHLFSSYGLPQQVVTDNGPQFIAEEFNEYMCSIGVKHFRTAPYHPATNGAVERLDKTFKRVMKMGQHEHEPYLTTLHRFLYRYRNTPHPVTGVSPAELFLRTEYDLFKPCYKDIVAQQQEKQKRGHDGNRAKDQSFRLEQRVVARDYRQGKPRWSKGSISSILGPRSYLVTLQDGTVCKRHTEQLHGWAGASEGNEGIMGDEGNDVSLAEEAQNPERVVASNADTPLVTPPPPTTPERRYLSRSRRPPDRPGFVSY